MDMIYMTALVALIQVASVLFIKRDAERLLERGAEINTHFWIGFVLLTSLIGITIYNSYRKSVWMPQIRAKEDGFFG